MPPPIEDNEPSPTVALRELVGARIDAAHANLDTGLVVLSAYSGGKRLLGVGIGPHVAGIGWLPRAPRVKTPATHPVLAAMRAHLVDHRVRDASVDEDGTVWIMVGGDAVSARIGLLPGRRGELSVIGADGRLVVRWPATATPQGAHRAFVGAPSDVAGAALVEASDRVALERAFNALNRAVGKRTQALQRRSEAVQRDLARLGNVGQLQKIGRLLLAQGGRIPRGASTATLEDWEEGGSVEVALDPSKPAKSQAETFFSKARRYQRGEASMARRLAETRAAAEALVKLAGELADAEASEATLTAMTTRARGLGVPVQLGTGAIKSSRTERARRPYHLYRSESGQPILVGRGGKDNDALTTRHARPHDLWLHAKGVAGAHVVVPLEKGTTCPAGLLVDAATLAAYHSDARGESVCEVSYVERRYVRKPRGSAAGAVTHEREKVMAVRREEARLERLLAARDDVG